MSAEALAQIYWLKIELNQYDLTTGFLRDGTRKGNEVQYHIYTIMIADAIVGIVPKCPQELGLTSRAKDLVNTKCLQGPERQFRLEIQKCKEPLFERPHISDIFRVRTFFGYSYWF